MYRKYNQIGMLVITVALAMSALVSCAKGYSAANSPYLVVSARSVDDHNVGLANSYLVVAGQYVDDHYPLTIIPVTSSRSLPS